jgi:hypothetical protein
VHLRRVEHATNRQRVIGRALHRVRNSITHGEWRCSAPGAQVSAVLHVDSRPVLGWPRRPEQVDLSRLCRRELHDESVSLPSPTPVVAGVGHE